MTTETDDLSERTNHCQYCEGPCVRPMKHNKKRVDERWGL